MRLSVSVAGNVTASISTPAGWTLIGAALNNSTNCTLALYYRFWQSGDAAPSVTWTGSNKNVSCIVPYLGVDATTPIDVTTPAFATGTSTTPTSPTATAATMGALREHIACRAGTSTSLPQDGMTEAVDRTSSATSPVALTACYQGHMASDASGTRFSTSTSAAWVAATVWLRPATPDTTGLIRAGVFKTAGGGTSFTAALASADVANSPTGTLMVVGVALGSATSGVVTAVSYGGGSVSLTEGPHYQNVLWGAPGEMSIWYKENCVLAGAAASVVVTATTDTVSIWVGEFKGLATSSAYDANATNNGTSTAPSVTSSTPANLTELVIAVFSNDGAGAASQTPSAGYLARLSDIGTSGAQTILVTEAEAATGGSAQTAAATLGASEPWGAVIATFKAASAGSITGSTAATLGALTGTSTGTVDVGGTTARTLGALTGTGTATVDVGGTTAKTLGALTGAGTGKVDVGGTLARTLGALTGTGAGGVLVGGTLARTLGALQSTGAGTVLVGGSTARTLGALTGSAQGTAEDPFLHAAGSATLSDRQVGGASLADALTAAASQRAYDPVLVAASAAAARTNAWRLLGLLTNDAFREADIIYNSDDAMYYVFNTEADGNPPPYALWTITASTPGNPTILQLDQPHGLAQGARRYLLTISGCDVTALNGSRYCTAPTATTLSVAVSTSVAATTGSVERIASTPQVGMRRAATPEGIAAASGADYISEVAIQDYFPTIVKEGSGAGSTWYMFGFDSTGATTRRRFLGASPTGPGVFGSASTLPMTLGDISVRRNPLDGKWYAVGIIADTSDDTTALYVNSDITNNAGWTQITADLWQGGALAPAWAAGNKPDPNIAFLDGRAYLLFTAASVAAPGVWSGGIAAIDLASGVVVGAPVQLSEPATYQDWQRGNPISDLVLLRGPDGVARIYGFVNAPADAAGAWGWGVLDLSAAVPLAAGPRPATATISDRHGSGS